MKNKFSYIILLLLYLFAFMLLGCDKQSENMEGSIKTSHSQVTNSLPPSDEEEKAASPFLSKPVSKAKK